MKASLNLYANHTDYDITLIPHGLGSPKYPSDQDDVWIYVESVLQSMILVFRLLHTAGG